MPTSRTWSAKLRAGALDAADMIHVDGCDAGWAPVGLQPADFELAH